MSLGECLGSSNSETSQHTGAAARSSLQQGLLTIGTALRRKGGFIQREFLAQPLKERCQQTVQLLQDIHLMMHADYFVGTSLSLGLHPAILPHSVLDCDEIQLKN